jgi:folate-binding protein YgfZ
MISKPVAQAFVPQMLNYESVGGVNFKKGCYPGQEVVARSQFRGVLKRRAFLAHCAATLKAGDEIFQASDAEQPRGLVAQAAASPTGGFDAIVSILVTAAQAGELHLATPDGPALGLAAAPYPLLSDI